MKNVSLPNSLKKIGSHAFNQTSITTISFGSGLEEIGNDAFSFSNLSGSITIPSNVKKIDYQAFECTPLTEIYVDAEEIGNLSFVDNWWPEPSRDKSTIKKITFGRNVKKLDGEVLHKSSALEEVVFEDPTNWVPANSCTPVDVSSTAKIFELMSANNGYIKNLRHFDNLSECQ